MFCTVNSGIVNIIWEIKIDSLGFKIIKIDVILYQVISFLATPD